MIKPLYLLSALALSVLCIYLFVQAPEPLPEEGIRNGQSIPINSVFQIVAAENNVARALWTGEIVGMGKKVGLKFDENWRDHDVMAGPLPALFLRESATSLEKNIVRLSLFLGSDFPINPSNLFSGRQAEAFKLIKADHQPQFFYASDTQLATAMFPDYASVQPCVDCHNRHPDTPKSNWMLNDIMGATTWSYPEEQVTVDEFLDILSALRKGFRDAYSAYIEKVANFSKPPIIGEKWPREGYFLPTINVFVDEFSQRASAATIAQLLSITRQLDRKLSNGQKEHKDQTPKDVLVQAQKIKEGAIGLQEQ